MSTLIDDMLLMLVCAWPIYFIIFGASALGWLTEHWEPAGRALDWMIDKTMITGWEGDDDADDWDDWEE